MGTTLRAAWLVIAAALILGIYELAWRPGSAEPRCEGERFALQASPGTAAPYILLSANDRRGPFLLDYGATSSSLSAAAFNGPIGSSLQVSNFSLPTFPSGQFRLANYPAASAHNASQMGVIGTDFLSLLTADFSYAPIGGSVVLGPKPCDPDVLRKRGMVAIDQAGFFGNSIQRLHPPNLNVPIIYMRIGDVVTRAQIDTGYEDLEARPSIDINEALYQKLLQSSAKLEAAGQLRIATCQGSEERQIFRILGQHVALQTETGLTLREINDVKLIRKVPNSCGGIGTLSTPAAQISASLAADFGRIVFDPHAEKVWVSPRR